MVARLIFSSGFLDSAAAIERISIPKNENAEKELIKSVFNLKEEIGSIVKVITPYLETRNNRFVVTDRMLEMFKKKAPKNEAAGTK